MYSILMKLVLLGAPLNCAEANELLSLVKDGNLERQYPRITKGVVDTAYPDIVWGSR